uniref:Lkrsdh1 n=1 Tax=Arundo donax TaxID=35708 RepID=A0A0A9HKC0_ARUDO
MMDPLCAWLHNNSIYSSSVLASSEKKMSTMRRG